MNTSRMPVLRTILVTLTSLCASNVGVARERGPRAEIVCPFPPIPATIGDRQVLAYELHLTNFDKTPLTLTSIAVYDDRTGRHELQSTSGQAVREIMIDFGASSASASAASERIESGQRAVVFLWITFDPKSRIPDELVHRISFHRGPGAKTSPSDPIDAVLDGYVVKVNRRSIPVLGQPFRDGVWVAGDGPANDSPHRRSLLAIDGGIYDPERFASDWVKVGPNGDSNHGTTRNEDFWAFGEPVLALSDGEVVDVKDGIPDNTPRTLPTEVTLDNILGNYVTMRLGSGVFVTYAHLKNGSMTVSLHQHVATGATIGLVGNSGQATAPHLHLEVTDGISGLKSQGIPFEFRSYVDDGPGETYSTDKHPATRRLNSLPGKDEVIDFSLRPLIK